MQSILDKYKKMKKIWLIILWLFMLSFSWNITRANNEYEYKNLDITANVLNDWTIDVIESFTADFFVNKHWIIRSIPLNYNVWWKDFHIEISDINVQWKNFTTNQYDWNIEIKIWDADVTLIWEQDYPISYSTYGLIRNFSWMGYAELYWNLVGYDFDTNINKIKAEIILPKTYTWFTKDDFLITTDWNSKTIDWFEWTVDWSSWDRIIITYDKWLWAYHWITLTIKFPNDFFQFDHDRQAGLIIDINKVQAEQYNENKQSSMKQFKKDVIMLFVFLFWILLYLLNKYYKKHVPFIIQYDPPKWISPSEVSILYNNKITPSCISSLICKWACEGRITIKHERERSLFFHSNNIKITEWSNFRGLWQQDNKCPTYELLCRHYLFDWLSETTLPNHKFSKNLIEINKKLLEHCKNEDLVKKNILWTTIAWFLIFVSIPLFPFLPIMITMFLYNNLNTIINLFRLLINWSIINQYWNIDNLIRSNAFTWILCWILMALIFSISIIYIFKSFSKLWNYEKLSITNKWKEKLSEIYWYKKFIESCEEPQLRKFIEEDPDYINKVLPYAVALWLETRLIKATTPIYQEIWYNFDWYDWNLTTLTSAMNSISDSFHEYSESINWSNYSSDSWFSSWSSFDSGWSSFSSWWGWWWWGWSSR